MSEEDKPSDISEAEWLSRSSFMDRNYETPGQKLVRKCKETPLVPIGIIATIGALSYGLYNFYKDRKMMQQYSMRARVAFQGLTFAAIMYSMYKEGNKRLKEKQTQSES